MEVLKHDPEYYRVEPTAPELGPPLWRIRIVNPRSLSRFSREICIFEKNVKLRKMFYIKFFTKMVPIKIFVEIILTKLQRFLSRANVKEHSAAGPEVSSPERTPEVRMARTDVIFEVGVQFYPQTM